MSKKKALYTGLFLVRPGRENQELLRAVEKVCGSLLPCVLSHHLTLKFKPAPSEVKALQLNGKPNLFIVEVIGVGSDNQAQAVVCVVPKLPDGVLCENKVPHITIATAEEVSPIYSNELLKNGFKSFNKPVQVVAGLGFFDGQCARYNYTGTIYESTGVPDV